ncbi:MAG: CsbD family protein [Myxococcota bacterium]|nr:CsbD family protein [Myxococcota bacterium]
MNWSILEGKWEQAEAKLRAKWSKLTDDDLGLVRANAKELVGRLRERYGYAKDEAERHVSDFLGGLGDSDGKAKTARRRGAARPTR